MKRKWVINGFLGLWAFALVFFIVRDMVLDVKRQNVDNSSYVEENFTIETTVGDISENQDSDETSNKTSEEINKEVPSKTKNSTENLTVNPTVKKEEAKNNNEEIKILTKKYGTVIYDKTTYKIVNNEKVKVKKETIIDASNYNASLKELKQEALSLLASNKEIAMEILAYTNNYREEVNRTNLELSDDLTLSAMIRALELAYSNKFTHQRPDGTYVDKLVKELNIPYKSLGENIAYGYKDAKDVTFGWRNSDGHYQNMINAKYHKVGIAAFTLNNNTYFVQVFSD